MPTLQTQIQTERASRYLVQFCRHAAAMGEGGHGPRMHLRPAVADCEVQVAAEWSDADGSVTFTPWGQVTLTAEGDTLTVRIDAADEEGLTRIRDIVTRNVERFSRRQPLTVTWQRSETAGAAPSRSPDGMTSKPRRGFSRSRLQTVLLALAVVLVIGLHAGLAGAVVAESPWTGIASNAVVAVVAVKAVLVVLTHFGLRRRRAAKLPDQR